MPSVMWFRRDLRLGDNPALLEAAADDVLPLFVLDPALWGPAGPVRRAYLGASLRALDASLRPDASLAVVEGDPVRRVVEAAREVGATRVHVAADYGPYGHRRDLDVEQALADAGIQLVRTGSPYAVAPGRVTNGSGDAVQGLHAVLEGLGRPRLARPGRRPGRHLLARPGGDHRHPGPRAPRRARAARGRRGRGPAPVARVPRRPGRRLRRRPRPAGRRRHLADVGAPQVGRDPPAHDAGRPGPAPLARAPRRTARSWPGGSSTPTCCSPAPRPRGSTSGPSSRRWSTTTRPTSSTPGARGGPASRSSTPACASCARPAGCTTGSG